MKKILATATAILFLSTGSAFCALIDELSDIVSSVSVSASGNIGGFKTDISAEFGVPMPKIDAIIAAVPTPGDAYMVMQISNITRKPPEEVITVYKAKKDKGWGAIAHELGIKPGSDQFHALKNGKYAQKAKGGKGGKGGGNGNGNGGGKGKKK
ncbi:hypothetical protein FDZ71_04600 [bacterium]|nr:MAG: hypothetical protein FDZ71_04600 [bacterium]